MELPQFFDFIIDETNIYSNLEKSNSFKSNKHKKSYSIKSKNFEISILFHIFKIVI